MSNKPRFVGEKVRVSDAFDLQMGKTPSRKNPDYWRDGDHDWVSIADLGSFDKFVGKTKERINDLGVKESGIKLAPANTVLMSFKLSLGKTAITVDPVYTNEAIMAFIDKDTYPVDVNFMYHQCKAKDWTSGTNTAVMGKTLNKKTLGQALICLPPLGVQKEIAGQLDFISDQIAQAEKQLSRLDQLVKSRFVEMFGDPAFNSLNLPLVTIEKFGVNRDSERRPVTKSDRNAGPYPYYGASGIVDYVDDYIFDEPLLLVSEDGANLLARTSPIAFLADGKTWINNHAHIVSCNADYDRIYLSILINMIDISEYVTGSAQPKINQAKLNQIPLMMPDEHLREEFAAFVQQVDKPRFIAQRQIEKLQMLYDSLAQEYFVV